MEKIKFTPGSLKQGQNWEEASIWRNKKTGVSIHKVIGCGDEWYMTCHEFGLSQIALNECDFDKAVEAAKKVIKKHIIDLAYKYEPFVDSEGFERGRY